jgi:drug/metabolite transporter (DMT)-like permease
MIALLLNILLSVGFFHVIRAAQVRGSNMMVVGAVNYVLASVACFAASYVTGNTLLSAETMFWGSIQGVAFIVTYYLICTTMNLSGMAIATAFVRLSVVLPVLASIFYWGEIPSHFQVIGIVVCLVSLPLIGMRARNVGTITKLGWRELRLVGMLFVFIGMAGIASKGFIMSGVTDAPTTFMGVLYGVAALGALGTFLFPAWKTHSQGVVDGIKMGIMNVASILAYLIALDQVAGVIVFPVQAAGGILANTVFAAVVWKERFIRRTLVGMGVAVVGLVLVNLK